MKKIMRSKKIIGIVLILLLALFTTKVYAANDSFSTTIKASKPQVTREEIVTITFGLTDIKIESGEKGIGAYTAGMKYDSSVLEYVSASGTDKWEAPLFENGLMVAHTKDTKVVDTTQDIGSITFKVKKDAKLGETTIELVNFSGSTVQDDVPAANQSVKITVVDNNGSGNSGNSNNGSSNNNNNGAIGNNNNNNNGSSNNSGNSNNGTTVPGTTNSGNDNKQADDKKQQVVLPKTGENNVLLFLCGGAVIVSIVLFIRMKMIDKK